MYKRQDCCSAITQLAQAGGFGVRVRFDPLTGAERLELLQGKDRSVQGGEWYRGYFGTRLRNLSAVSLAQDASDYALSLIHICRSTRLTWPCSASC